MILLSHGIIGSSIVQIPEVIDPDAQAFFDRVISAGGTLSKTEQRAINTLVIQMKLDGIWTKMKAIYPMVGGGAESCAQNLKSSSFTGQFYGSWSFSNSGIKGSSSGGAYVDTFINDLNDLGTNATLSVYTTDAPTIQQWDLGVFVGSGNISGISVKNSILNTAINVRSRLESSFSDSYTKGLFTGTNDASNNYVYKNNILKNTLTKVSSGLNLKHFINCLNQNGNPNFYNNSKIVSVFFGHETFSQNDMDNFYNLVLTFQTTLSRQ